MDCLGQGGTPSDVADLAYSLFPPAPPGVVLPPHPDLPGVQLYQSRLPANSAISDTWRSFMDTIFLCTLTDSYKTRS